MIRPQIPQINEGLEVLPGVEAVLKALAGRPNTVTGLARRHFVLYCAVSVTNVSAAKNHFFLTGHWKLRANRLVEDGCTGAR